MSIEKIIADISKRIEVESAGELLRAGLTLDNRIPWEVAFESLAPAERYACDRILTREHRASLHSGNLSLAFRPHGRLYLLPRAEYDADADALTLLGHVDLESSDLEAVHARRQSAQNELESHRAAICAELNRHGFEAVGAQLGYVAEHMAPLIYYVGERCISNFYDIGKSGFALEMTLSDTLHQVCERRELADIEALTVAYCLHLAVASGGYTRLEELNSRQLSLDILRNFFDRKRDFYRQLDGCGAEVSDATTSLPEMAAALAQMREAIGSRQRFVRLITGVNLLKREAVLPIPPVSVRDIGAPPAIDLPPDSQVRSQIGLLDIAELLGTAPDADDPHPRFASSFEQLVDRVVAEAVARTGSDFGMTRSVRDYRGFADALQRRQTAVVCGWSQAEYFCHVVPSESVLKGFSKKSLFMTLNAISARMRYNTWHYVPSYFDPADVAAERGWFTAPRMADIADDSDQHHTGHVHAAVRYSIRSPLPLRIRGEVLPGFIDLRLMRQSGEPYNQQDLVTAIAYTEALQFLYQRLMNHVLERDVGFTFSFGDRSWFERVYPARPLSPQAALVEPALSA